jgi:hypothetical protein
MVPFTGAPVTVTKSLPAVPVSVCAAGMPAVQVMVSPER